MKIHIALLGTALLGLFGCGKQATSDPGNTTLATYQAICQITDAQGSPVVCIDYPQRTATQDSTCMTTERNAFTAAGAVGVEYLAISSAGASTSCALTNPNTILSLSCGVAGQIVRYYSRNLTLTQIQSDCTARRGNLFPNEG